VGVSFRFQPHHSDPRQRFQLFIYKLKKNVNIITRILQLLRKLDLHFINGKNAKSAPSAQRRQRSDDGDDDEQEQHEEEGCHS